MKDLGYGKEYKYAHSFEGNFVDQDFLPEKIKERRFYKPQQNPTEEKKSWKDYGSGGKPDSVSYAREYHTLDYFVSAHFYISSNQRTQKERSKLTFLFILTKFN